MTTIQVPSALLEACVLSTLVKQDAYGYSLTQSIKETLDVSESTLYPVLRRLETDGLLFTYDEPHNGRNRRYYQITKTGRARQKELLEQWQLFQKAIDKVLKRRTK